MTGRIKALLVLVVVMGMMIVVGTIALAVGIAQKLGGQTEVQPGVVNLAVAAGTEVVGATSDGRQLVLWRRWAGGSKSSCGR